MKLLHTSDWHLGRSLYGKKRYQESEAFLNWLADRIEEQEIDVLLIAGDVFDTSTPSNRAQELYYRFLCRVAGSRCRHVVVIGGNHDSPSFLNAPRDLLRVMNVQVVGAADENPANEVILLDNENGEPAVIICAVPYLRDRDVRTVEPGESVSDKSAKLIQGLSNHYKAVFDLALTKQQELEEADHGKVPIVAMGHLFTSGGRRLADDGVRELYAGTLAHIGEDVFPPFLSYVALGHLHVPQSVGEGDRIRYSGSPIPIGFGESDQSKSVVIVAVKDETSNVQFLSVPCFQRLVRIAGSLEEIISAIDSLKQEYSTAWLEIDYPGESIAGNLREDLNELIKDSSLEIRRIRNRQIYDRVIDAVSEKETLDDLEPGDVFRRCLDVSQVPEEERSELIASYKEIVNSLLETDSNSG